MPPAALAFLQQILWPVLIPGTIAGVLLLLAWRPWVRGEHAETGAGAAWVLPVTAGAGFIVAFISQEWPLPAYPFGASWQHLLVAAGLMTLVGAIASVIRLAWLSLLVAAAGTGAALWFVSAEVSHLDDPSPRLMLVGAAIVSVMAIEALAARRPGPVVPALFWLAFTGVSVTILFGGFAKLSLIAAGMSAVAGGAVVCGTLHPRFRAARGGAAVLAAMFVLVLPTAWLYEGGATLGPVPFVLLGLIPLAGWLGELPIFGRLALSTGERAGDTPDGGPPLVRGRRRLAADAARLLIPALLTVAAIAVARGAAAPADGDAGDNEGIDSIYGG